MGHRAHDRLVVGGQLVRHPLRRLTRCVRPQPVVVGPGDTLKTTCSFNNDSGGLVTFGNGTSDEMCYNFVVAYPVGALATGGSFLGGENKCMR